MQYQRARLNLHAPVGADAGQRVAKIGEAAALNVQFVVGVAGKERGPLDGAERAQPPFEGLSPQAGRQAR